MDETEIYQLTDYLLLNAYSVNSSGFYNGKAGFSLCLFEAARLFGDAYLEDHAFELLQEALVSRNPDIGFENGLAGIGYVLRYLIVNGFIRADFEALFGAQMSKIRDGLAQAGPEELQAGRWLSVGYLLNDPPTLEFLAGPVATQLESYFSTGYRRDPGRKLNRLSLLALWLKVVQEYPGIPGADGLLGSYARCYAAGRLVSRYDIGHYLGRLAGRLQLEPVQEAARRQMDSAAADMRPDTMFLSRRIDGLYLLAKNESRYLQTISRLEQDWTGRPEKTLEDVLTESCDTSLLTAGYEGGAGRFLLYLVWRRARACGEDTSRFDSLFK